MSDALSNGTSTLFTSYQSLLYAMFIPPFLAALGGFCFFNCSFYLVKDKAECLKLTHGELKYLRTNGNKLGNDHDVPGPIRETPSSQKILDPVNSVSNSLATQNHTYDEIKVDLDTESSCDLCDNKGHHDHHDVQF